MLSDCFLCEVELCVLCIGMWVHIDIEQGKIHYLGGFFYYGRPRSFTTA